MDSDETTNLEHDEDGINEFFFDDDLFSKNRVRVSILSRILSILPSNYAAKLEHSDGVTEIFLNDGVNFRVALLHEMPDYVCMLHKTTPCNDDGIDRISDMPDAILCKILSCLPTKNAVAAKMLSTRWKTLFPFIWIPPVVIDIDDSLFFNSKNRSCLTSQLHNFTDQLLQETRPRMDTLNITSCDDDKMLSWVHAAKQLHVREISLYFESRVFCSEKMLTILNGYTSLTSLKFFKLIISLAVNPLHDFVLPNLKTLVFSDIEFYDDGNFLNNIIKGCPALESLILSLPYSRSWLSIQCPLLKNLTIKNGYGTCLQIDAPNLEVLICKACYTNYTVSYFESLITADIDVKSYQYQSATGLKEFVDACSSTVHLTITTYVIDAVSSAELPIFKNLNQLSLNRIELERWWTQLARLLCKAPNLQKLTFNQGLVSYDGYWRFKSVVANHPPICLDRHLKEIEFFDFLGRTDEIKLVDYFLTHGKVIETLKIHYSSPGYSQIESCYFYFGKHFGLDY